MIRFYSIFLYLLPHVDKNYLQFLATQAFSLCLKRAYPRFHLPIILLHGPTSQQFGAGTQNSAQSLPAISKMRNLPSVFC